MNILEDDLEIFVVKDDQVVYLASNGSNSGVFVVLKKDYDELKEAYESFGFRVTLLKNLRTVAFAVKEMGGLTLKH
jgi:hypothetical protein